MFRARQAVLTDINLLFRYRNILKKVVYRSFTALNIIQTHTNTGAQNRLNYNELIRYKKFTRHQEFMVHFTPPDSPFPILRFFPLIEIIDDFEYSINQSLCCRVL